jgi:hypothetical protein
LLSFQEIASQTKDYITNIKITSQTKKKKKLPRDCITNIVSVIKRELSSGMDKWNSLAYAQIKIGLHLEARRNLGPKRGGKQGEFAGTCTCLKCIPKGWLVVAANAGSHDPVHVL